MCPGLPSELEQIVSKALAKNRNERYQTINELLAELSQLRRKLEVEQTLGEGHRIESSSSEVRNLSINKLRTSDSCQ
jgi:serine/threonine protein kinase